jgi:hypothetical protein
MPTITCGSEFVAVGAAPEVARAGMETAAWEVLMARAEPYPEGDWPVRRKSSRKEATLAGLAQGTGTAMAQSRGPPARPTSLAIENFYDSGSNSSH